MSHSLKVRLEKAIIEAELDKSDMTDQIWREKSEHFPLWDEKQIILREWCCKVRKLQEVVYINLSDSMDFQFFIFCYSKKKKKKEK